MNEMVGISHFSLLKVQDLVDYIIYNYTSADIIRVEWSLDSDNTVNV